MGGTLWGGPYGADPMGRTLWGGPYGGDPMGGTLWAEAQTQPAKKCLNVGFSVEDTWGGHSTTF